MWQSWVEMNFILLRISITSLSSKHCISERPLRVHGTHGCCIEASYNKASIHSTPLTDIQRYSALNAVTQSNTQQDNVRYPPRLPHIYKCGLYRLHTTHLVSCLPIMHATNYLEHDNSTGSNVSCVLYTHETQPQGQL